MVKFSVYLNRRVFVMFDMCIDIVAVCFGIAHWETSSFIYFFFFYYIYIFILFYIFFFFFFFFFFGQSYLAAK